MGDSSCRWALLVKHVDPVTGEEWWIPPGGGYEDKDPTVVACAIREAYEETGLDVSIGKLVYLREFHVRAAETHHLELYFLGDAFEGRLTIENAIGEGPDEDYIQDVRWVPREEASRLTVYPPHLLSGFWEDRNAGFPEVRYLGRDEE